MDFAFFSLLASFFLLELAKMIKKESKYNSIRGAIVIVACVWFVVSVILAISS